MHNDDKQMHGTLDCDRFQCCWSLLLLCFVKVCADACILGRSVSVDRFKELSQMGNVLLDASINCEGDRKIHTSSPSLRSGTTCEIIARILNSVSILSFMVACCCFRTTAIRSCQSFILRSRIKVSIVSEVDDLGSRAELVWPASASS